MSLDTPDEPADLFESIVTRGVATAARAREVTALEMHQRRDVRAAALGIPAAELQPEDPPSDAIIAACIVASAVDAHREALQHLATLPGTGALSRADREHAEQVTEVLAATQNTLSALNDARNAAVRDLQAFVALAGDPRSSLDGHVEMVRAVIDSLKRAGAPKAQGADG